MSYKEYASKEYVQDNLEQYAFKQQWETTDNKKVVQINNEGVAQPQELLFDVITMIDRISGCKCYVYVEDGKLTSSLAVTGIEVASMPTNTTYMEGQAFDPTGMVVNAILADGSTSEIADYTYGNVTGSEFVISYIDVSGAIVSTTINLTVTEFDPTVELIDFEYDANDDGTYTITGWKQTLNGEQSTEMILPNNSLIII